MTPPIKRDRAAARLHVLGALSLAGWLFLAFYSRETRSQLPGYLVVNAWAWLAFALALVICRRNRGSGLLGPLVFWSVAFRVAGFFAVPVMEDDYFRFLWDGRQLALTGNPYAAAPAVHFTDPNLPERFCEILDQISYPHVPTIYGPVCQVGFVVSYWIAAGQLWPWKLIVFCADLIALFMVHRLAATHAGSNPENDGSALTGVNLAVLIFGWCPLAVFETSFNAHPDILGIALLLAALVCWRSKAPSACAILCALAVAAKVFALPLVPFLIGRRTRTWVVFAGVLAVCYAPFWLQGSLADWGGLSAFAAEWEFNSSVFAVARRLLGPAPARLVCGISFAVFWCALLVRWLVAGKDNQAECIPPGTVLVGGFLLLSATVNPWYLLWMLPFIALEPTAAGLTALATVSLSYVTGLNLGNPAFDNFAHPSWVRPIEYGTVAIAGAADWWLFKRRSLIKK